MSKAGILVDPTLVGREKELEELHSLLNLVAEGKGKTVFVCGEAGSGKTRLTREFLNAAVKRGVAVMAGWCLSDSQVPYFPFMEAFNNYYAASSEGETSLLQPQAQLGLGTPTQIGVQGGGLDVTSWLAGPRITENVGKPPALSPQGWKDQVFDAVSRTLHSIAIHSPVILVIEDVHWADSASLALLHYVARAVHDSERVLLLATFRSDELTADTEGRPHPLAETLRLMRREELFAEIELQGLSQGDVSRMAECLINGDLETELAAKLSSESKGNPLFIVESLRMLSDRKSLVQENNRWRLAVDDLVIPSKIKDIILRRMACLKYPQRRVLDAASVIGEEFNVELLSAVLGQDILEVLEILSVVAHSTSLVHAEENLYRFDHARSRETLYEELSPPLKRGYHLRIAEKLEGMKDGILPLSDLAFHYDKAGNRDKAVKYALSAGKDELARWSNTQAIKHFLYVLKNVPEGHPEEKRTALEGLGDAYAANLMYAEAIKTFDVLAASESGIVKLRAIRKASDAAYAKGDKPDLLIEYARRAEELRLTDRLEMARIIDNRGKAHFWAGRGGLELDLADYDAALKVFEEENSLADTAEALWRSGNVFGALGESAAEKGLSEVLRSVSIFRELGEVRKEIVATIALGSVFGAIGLFPEERCAYFDIIKLGEKLGVFDELALASLYLSLFEAEEGNLEKAISWSLKALDFSKKTDAKYVEGFVYAVLTLQYSQFGDLKQADEYFNKMIKLPPETITPSSSYYGGLAKMVYFAAKARWEESNRCFEKMKDAAKIYGMEIAITGAHAWSLEKQGRHLEAKVQNDKIQGLMDQFEKRIDARFGHANLQLGFLFPRKVSLGQEFEMRLDLVNVGRKHALPIKIEGIAHGEFSFSDLPPSCSLQNGSLVLKDKSVGPFEVETLKLRLSVLKAESYNLNPVVFYMDDLGNTKTFKLNPITVTVEPAKPAFEVLPGREVTGTAELDRLLLGGIPEGYAVALVSPAFEECRKIIENYIEAGLKCNQTTFYLTAEPGRAKALAEEYPSGMLLFVCNPRADLMVRDLPNVYKIKGVDSLTEIDIALTKASRLLNASANQKRACIEVVSDVLLQHHAVTTRKWLSGMIQDLKSKGFTTLAVVNPRMHPQEELEAVSGLFDGEIRLFERETASGPMKILRITRLQGQSYLKEEVTLN